MTEILSGNEPPEGQIILFRSDDGQTRLEVRLQNESIWLSLNQMAELFDRDKSVISKHIDNAYAESEIRPEGTLAKFATVQTEGPRSVRREIEYYNLDVIISVGYRVKSQRGTQFRIWATQRLREYLIKGFAIDDARLKQAGGGSYFDELLAKIRDIRSSERVFWRKVLDIYATSVDYDPRAEASALFFKTIQNKMHWAAHGHTAAEIVQQRADAGKPNMGLTAWACGKPRKSDIAVAKNYLNAEELDALNRIVTAYLEFAELQAMNKRPMTMSDWISKLDDFLRLSDRELLNHAGKVSHDHASQVAIAQFELYRKQQDSVSQPVDRQFDQTLDELTRIESKAKKKKSLKSKKHDLETE